MLSKLCIASGTNRQDIATVPPHKRGERERERKGKGKSKIKGKAPLLHASCNTYNISISGLDFGFSFPFSVQAFFVFQQFYMEIVKGKFSNRISSHLTRWSILCLTAAICQ